MKVSRWQVAGVAVGGAAIAAIVLSSPELREARVQPEGGRAPVAARPEPAPLVAQPPVAVQSPAPDVERELFAQAEASLNVDASGAIALLNEGDAKFPRGALAHERQFLKLRARVNLNQIAEARVDATNYLALNPRSPIAARIHRLLGIRPPPEFPAPPGPGP